MSVTTLGGSICASPAPSVASPSSSTNKSAADSKGLTRVAP
eukprot:CAMPEP_0176133414 /NCGR_PEP_ID=MMETSP0120_2-20121206/67622_1 /TAXON_ID=160619 /ORGANISM="Kryptoperidinium foliaceum, Strain CCMP 1326" /LENGTH=40 /DNA_ID= /DNA_START= /DNA_END= /DNA_ORIENTATION=